MSFHGFVNEKNSTVVLSCFRRFVGYYLSKGFVILEKSSALRDVSLSVKQIINAEILHKNILQWHATEKYLLLSIPLKVLPFFLVFK